MKALSLTQPWASLVVDGIKRIETRSWSTNYRGPLLIHASKGMTQDAWDLVADLRNAQVPHNPAERGAIIGLVELVRVETIIKDPVTWQWIDEDGNDVKWDPEDEAAYGDYTPGRYAWLLAKATRLPPEPALGHLSLWETEDPRG